MEEHAKYIEEKEENVKLNQRLDAITAQNLDLCRLLPLLVTVGKVSRLTLELQDIKKEVKAYKEIHSQKAGLTQEDLPSPELAVPVFQS